MRPYLMLLIVALGGVVASGVRGQDVEGRLKALEEQNRKLSEENRRIHLQNGQILDRLAATEQRNEELLQRLNASDDVRRQQVDLLTEQLARAIDTDPGGPSSLTRYDLTRSGFSLQFYGRIRFESHYNSARFNRPVDPQWLLPEDGINASENDAAFVADARLSTIGLNLDGGRIGDARVRGKIEFDFANFDGLAEARPTPRLLLAYVDLDFGNWGLRFGQDWDVISPYDPLVDEQRHLWDTGNLGDRRPMAQFHWTGGDQSGIDFSLEAAIGLTGAVDNLDNDIGFGSLLSSERDGFDAAHPHFQLGGSVGFASWVPGQRVRVGAWGLIGALETDTLFGPAGSQEDEFTIWGTGVDLFLPITQTIHLKAEAFLGEALSDFHGGIGQSINQTTGDEIRTKGGFAELYWQTTELFGFGVGGSIDNPDFDDLDVAMRASNWTVYLATRFDWGGGLRSGLDVMFWKTQYVQRDEGEGFRVNAFVELGF